MPRTIFCHKTCPSCNSAFVPIRTKQICCSRECANRYIHIKSNKPSIIDRFMKFVSEEPNSGCWIWMGWTNKAGYGMCGIRGGEPPLTYGKLAHCVSYALFRGQVPAGLELDHLCRFRCCCNPQHLEAVTHQINMSRGISGQQAKERAASRTHCPHGHEFSEENTISVRNKQGYVGRGCKECGRERVRAYRKRLSLRRRLATAAIQPYGDEAARSLD